jgi:hypothetical protein
VSLETDDRRFETGKGRLCQNFTLFETNKRLLHKSVRFFKPKIGPF